MKKKIKVASILRVRDEYITGLWLNTLPVEISKRARRRVLKSSKYSSYILWRRPLGFKFFE